MLASYLYFGGRADGAWFYRQGLLKSTWRWVLQLLFKLQDTCAAFQVQ
jgi:hypothetical protein